MTEAEDAIAELDDALAQVGQDVILRRATLGPNSTQINFDVTCRAAVTLYQPADLVQGSGIIQGDSKAIMGFSEITRAGWPGAQPSAAGDKRVPRAGDKLIVDGRVRNIQAANPVDIGGTLVRLELQLRG